MKIEQEFEVAASPDSVWAFLDDVPSVAACLPGATLAERGSEGVWAGSVAVSLGPLDLTFEGTATIAADPVERTGRVSGSGADRRGGSRGRIEISYAVSGHGDGSLVTIDADLTLAGPAAQFGRTGLVAEVARRLMTDFASCVEARLDGLDDAPTATTGPIKGGRLLAGSVWAAVRRFFRRLLGR